MAVYGLTSSRSVLQLIGNVAMSLSPILRLLMVWRHF